MKKNLRKLITVFITAFVMTVMLPVAAQAAVKVSSGDGSEKNPYMMTLSGACKEEPFKYNIYPDREEAYYYASFIKIKATKVLQITVRDAENFFNFKRTEKDQWRRENEFIIRSGETVFLKVRAQGSVNNTMKITAKAVSSDEYCPKNPTGIHTFGGIYYRGECIKYCGYTCKHPKEGRKYDYSYYENVIVNGVSKHMPLFWCSTCESKGRDLADAKPCTVKKWTKKSNEEKHHGICTVCNWEAYGTCKYKTTYGKGSWSIHYVSDKCTVCGVGSSKAIKTQNHSFKKNVCTKCKFKRVVPGTLKISSLRQSGKMKKSYYTVQAHWEKRSGTYYWIPAKKAAKYEYKIYYKLSSANAKKYIISTHPKWNASGYWLIGTNKKSSTIKFNKSSAIKNITLYITPVSKTGTPGKTIKKVIKLS